MVLAAVLAVVFMSAGPLLRAAGRYLSVPSSNQNCDVLIVESGSTVADYVMQEAIRLYQNNRVQKIMIVLHTYDLNPGVFGMNNYDQLVVQAFDSLGIPASGYSILHLGVKDPYTYNTAVALTDTLIRKNVKSVLLLNDNFHIRRSLLTYRKAFQPTEIKVYPHVLPIYLTFENWWRSGNGWRRVVGEYLKLAFYFFNGYI